MQEELILNQNNQRSLRLQRVKRIKMAIVIIALIMLLLPTVICTFLGFRVYHLQKQVDQLIIESNEEAKMSEQDSITKSESSDGSRIDNTQIMNNVKSDTNIGGTEGLEEGIDSKNDFKNWNDLKNLIQFKDNNEQNDNIINNDNNNENDNTSYYGNNDNNELSDSNGKSNSNESKVITETSEHNDYDDKSRKELNSETNIEKDPLSALEKKTQDRNTHQQPETLPKPDELGKLHKNEIKQSVTETQKGIININEQKDLLQLSAGSINISSIRPEAGGLPESKEGVFSGKKVYLTFDDGPSKYSNEILDILAEYNVKATFFVIGKTDESSKQIYRRIVEEGHTLGMHSYSHIYNKIYNSVEDFDKDFTKLWKLLYDTTGYNSTIFRFPGGSGNSVSKNKMHQFIKYLNDNSILYYDWNVVNKDATGVAYTKEELINHVITGVTKKKTSIVLLHDADTKKNTVDSLLGLLKKLLSEGAELLPLDESVPPIQQIKANSIQ